MFLAFLLTTAFAVPYSTYTTSLDPSPIGYPNSWFSSTIDLSSNHATQSVTLLINCNVLPTLNIGTYVTITLPGFPTTTASTTLAVAQPTQYDNVFNFTGIILPTTPNAYGPITISVFSVQNGDLIASAAAYGSIQVVAAKATASTLTLTYSTATVLPAATSVGIVFSFTLATTLYANDYLVISVPSPFIATSSVATNFLTNNSTSSGNIYFLNSSSIQSNTLSSSSNVIVYGIYGFNSTGGSVTVSGVLNGISLPNYWGSATTGSTWNLEIFRFGTHTTRVLYAGTGPSAGTGSGAGLVAGTVTINSWGTTNGYLTNVFSGLTTFTDLSISTANDIPSGGSIVVTFGSTVKVDNYYLSAAGAGTDPTTTTTGNKYLYAQPAKYFNFVSAPTITATSVTLTLIAKIPAGTTIIITTLTTFPATAATVTAITTSDSTPNTIGALATSQSPYSFGTYQTSGYTAFSPAPTFQLWSVVVASSQTIAPLNAGTNTINSIGFSSILQGTTSTSTSTTSMIVSGPFSTSSTNQDTTLGFTSNYFLGVPGTGSTLIMSGTSYSTSITDTTTSATLTFSGSQFKFNSPVVVASGGYINFVLYTGAAGAAGTLTANYLPNFSANIYTRYEICFQYTISPITYAYCRPFTIFPNTVVGTVFDMVCSSTGQAGITAKLQYTPTAVTTSSSNSLLVTFTIKAGSGTLDPGLGTGLASGSVFPTSLTGTTQTITIWWPTSSTTVTNINYVPSNSPTTLAATAISFYFPFVSLVASQGYTATVALYIVRQSDSAQFLLQQDTAGATITGQASAAFGTTSVTATSGSTGTAGTTISSLVITNTFSGTAGISIILPSGFTLSSPSISVTTANTPVTALTSTISISSTLFSSLYNANLGGTVPTIITLSGIVPPNWIPVAGTATNIIISTAATGGALTKASACADKFLVPLTISAPALTLVKLTPATSTSFTAPGPTAPTLTLVCALTVPGTIIGTSATTITATLGYTMPIGTTYIVTAGSISIPGTTTVSGSSITTSAITSSIVGTSTSLSISITFPTPATSINGFSSVTIGYSSSGTQYTLTGITHALTLSTTANAAVLSGLSSVSAFPNTLGAKNVFFQIVFNPSVTIPAGSVITISGGEGFGTDSNVALNTWSTLGFTAVSISGTSLLVTTRLASTSGTAITIRKDLAYTAPASSTAGAAWLISISAPGSISIISDTSTTTTTSNSITYAAAPTALVTSFAVGTNTTNAGEVSYYKFSFQFSVALLSSYSIVINPPYYFDATFGPITSISGSSLNYLSSMSSLTSSPLCSVNHWLITCALGVQVSASSTIDISILATNPPVTSSTSAFLLYIVDSSSSIKGISQPSTYTSLVTPIPLANIDLQSVVVSSNQAVYSDYTFIYSYTNSEAYLASGTVSALFPTQYNFYRDQTTTSTSGTCLGAYSIATASGLSVSCTLSSNNLATFVFSAAQTFSVGAQVNLTVRALTNPIVSSSYASGSYGASNTPLDPIYGPYFGQYNFWTSKFSLYTTTSPLVSSTAWTSRTYPNANAAFIGFMTVTLLSFNAPTVNVIPGTYSSYYSITTASGTLSATQLALSPTSTGLAISPTILNLYPSATSALFKVGAPITTVASIYYITWTITETPTTSGTLLYLSIYKSQVQVYSSNTIGISATTPAPMLTSGTSLPIILSIAPYYTYSGLTLTPVLNSTTISFTPSSLSLSGAINSLGFQVVTASAVSNTYSVSITISGTDALAYSFTGSISITIGSTIPTITLSNIAFPVITSNSFTVTAQSTGSANIYWVVSTTYAYTINPNYSNLTYVKQYAYPTSGSPSTTQVALAAQYTTNNATLNTVTGTSYLSYTISLLVAANANVLYYMDFTAGGSKSYSASIYGLVANTNYTITIWGDNLSGNISNITGNVTTASVPNTVFAITFQNNPTGLSSNLITALASITGQPSYLFIKISGFRRNLGTSVSTALLASPVNTGSTTSAAASVTSAALSSSLANLGVANAGVASITPTTSSTTSSSTFPNPTYTVSPMSNLTSKIIYANFTSAVSGLVYYVLEYNPSSSYSIASTNVVAGQGRNGVTPYLSGSSTASAGTVGYLTQLNLTLAPSGTYWLSLDLCNSIGVCQVNSSISTFSYTYTNSSSSTSSSKNLMIALCALLALVL